MKHTNFYDKYQSISEQERRELAAAVEAHGGEYVFIPEDSDDWDDDDQVIIKASRQYYDEDKDCYVSRVTVNENGELYIYGFDTMYDSPSDEYELFNIEYGHLEYILDAIPETNDVRDVSKTLSENEKTLLVLSREDVESVGYDSNMTDDQFQSLTSAMSKIYESHMDMYWDALRQACENVNLTPINK